MKSPQYYVQSLELDVEPNFTDIDFGGVSLDFEVDDAPEYNDDLGALQFESTLDLTLHCYPRDLQDADQDSEFEVGTVDIEMSVILAGEESEFEEYISTWVDDGYRSVDYSFRYHVESGILTDVFSPISGLVDNSYRGVLPGIAFTEPPVEETDRLPIEKSDFLREYVETNVHRAIVNKIESELGEEIHKNSVVIDIDEELSTVNVTIDDGYEDILDRDEIDDVISDIYYQIADDETGDEKQIRSVEIIEGENEESSE